MNHTMVLILSIFGGATFGSLISAMLYLTLEPVAIKARRVFRRVQDARDYRKEAKPQPNSWNRVMASNGEI